MRCLVLLVKMLMVFLLTPEPTENVETRTCVYTDSALDTSAARSNISFGTVEIDNFSPISCNVLKDIHSDILQASLKCCYLESFVTINDLLPERCKVHDICDDPIDPQPNSDQPFYAITRIPQRTLFASFFDDMYDGATWVSIIRSEGPFIFSQDEQEKVQPGLQILYGLARNWRYYFMLHLASGFAAIVIWVTDRKRNPRDFPMRFTSGWWEGFWWAYVTMTTVGYGDKKPVSIIARLFGVLWMMIGIIMTSVATAAMTTSFTASILSGEKQRQSLIATPVGVLNNSEEEKIAVYLGAFPEVYNSMESLLQAPESVTYILIDDTSSHRYETNISETKFKKVGRIPSPSIYGFLIQPMEGDLDKCITRNAIQSVRTKTEEDLEHNQEISIQTDETALETGIKDIAIILAMVAGTVLVPLFLWDQIYYKRQIRLKQKRIHSFERIDSYRIVSAKVTKRFKMKKKPKKIKLVHDISEFSDIVSVEMQ